MSLQKWQVEEISAFDWKKRTELDFDGRRYGSVTGQGAARLTEAWIPCHGSNVHSGKKRPTRKTLRYNYLVVGDRPRTLAEVIANEEAAKPPQWGKLEVTVVHVAVRLNGAYRQVVKEVGRWHIKTGKLELRDIDYHGIGGWIVEWPKNEYAGGGKKSPGRKAETGPLIGKPIDDGWYSGGKWDFNNGLTFPYHETINLDALKGTRYEYCQYADDTPCKAGLVDWLMMYRAEPKIELLAKMGLYNLICPSGIKALKDKRIRDWIIAHREEVTGNPDAQDLIYAARHNVTVKYAAKRHALIHDIVWRRRFWNIRVKVRLDYDRLMKALPKWHAQNEEYLRYLEYAIKCGLDLRNEGTTYPPTKGGRKAFMDRLEAMEARAAKKSRAEMRARRAAQRKAEAERKAREEAEKEWIARTMKTRIKELEAFQKSLKRTDILKGCGYTLVLAKSQKELLAEGKKMHNCVGCGTYGHAIAKGESLIVMLKDRSGSYCDIEIDRKSWKVWQCYLKRNQPAPEEIHELAKKIAAWFKVEHLRQKKRKMFPELEDGRKKLFNKGEAA